MVIVGNRSPLLRALAIWLLIIVIESVHGILRTLYLAPLIGDFRARQVSVGTASIIILVITYLTVRWIGAKTTRDQLLVGATWVVLTLVFEFGLGRLVLGLPWGRLLEDYDLRHGGLMPLGLVVMGMAPWIAWRLRQWRNSAAAILLLPLLVALITSCTSKPGHRQPPPDLTGHKAETIYFLLGTLNEYLGRHIVEDGDLVESFYCNEDDKAQQFGRFLHIMTKEQNLSGKVEQECVQGCLTLFHSTELTDFFNSFYRYQLSSEKNAEVSPGHWKRTAVAFVTMDFFSTVPPKTKLAYLAGAYWRHGHENTFVLANAKHKAEVISGLLREAGCTDVKVESNHGLIPQTNTVFFNPTEEVAGWLRKGQP